MPLGSGHSLWTLPHSGHTCCRHEAAPGMPSVCPAGRRLPRGEGERTLSWDLCFAYLCSPGLPRWLRGKESACQCRRCGLSPWVGKIPWRRAWQPTPALIWRIPWTEEPGGLQFKGSQSQTRLSTQTPRMLLEYLVGAHWTVTKGVGEKVTTGSLRGADDTLKLGGFEEHLMKGLLTEARPGVRRAWMWGARGGSDGPPGRGRGGAAGCQQKV